MVPRPGETTGTGHGIELDLRLLATTDLHMHILPYDYVADRPTERFGLARTATLIRAARAEAANCLLFDNGDFLHGTPMGDEIARAARRGDRFGDAGPHPIVAAMAHLGYDAVTLGNHEFDHGVEFLGAALEGTPFPVVASNLSLRPTAPWLRGRDGGPMPRPVAIPFALLDRQLVDRAGRGQNVRIGLLGFLPPGPAGDIAGEPFQLDIRDIMATARLMVPQLRALGADLVIALAHSGIGAAEATEGMENAVVPLAGLDGLDAVIAGHRHQLFPGPGFVGGGAMDPEAGLIYGTPVVAPGFWGSHLGVIDLVLRRDDLGRWQVSAARAEARPIAGDPAQSPAPADRTLLTMMERLHEATLEQVRRPVGETSRALHSYFAPVAPSPALETVLRAQLAYVAQHLEGTGLSTLPLLASAAPFKTGGIAGPGFYTHVPPGPITLKSLTDLYLYPNDLAVLRLTGAELADWLERAASLFCRLEPGRRDQPLLDAGAPAYGYEVVGGLDYEIDLAAPARFTPQGQRIDPAARRLRELRLPDGRRIEPEEEVLLVTNSFRVSGGGAYPEAHETRRALALSVPMRDVLRAYLAGPGEAPPLGRWRFAAMPGTEAWFLSAPEAEGFLGETGERRIRAGAQEPDGFRRYWLSL